MRASAASKSSRSSGSSEKGVAPRGEVLPVVLPWLVARLVAERELSLWRVQAAEAGVHRSALSEVLGDRPTWIVGPDGEVEWCNPAGDLALTFCATGGVYIGGGIAPRYVSALQASGFRRRFEAKGRYRDWLAGIPAQVITAPEPALRGLALLARS